MNTKASFSFAMATAALLLAGCSSSDSTDSAPAGTAQQQALIKCEGANECKGTSECKSSTNANGCQGLNECKGQGWITIPKEECDKKGGKVLSEGGDNGSATPTPPAADGGKTSPGTKTASVKCEGINECKGTSDCKSSTNECKGMNDCKGHGYLEIPSAAECLEKGGKVQA